MVAKASWMRETLSEARPEARTTTTTAAVMAGVSGSCSEEHRRRCRTWMDLRARRFGIDESTEKQRTRKARTCAARAYTQTLSLMASPKIRKW